jgi:8-oxo-dGTP pyrophosphatase MutT (NUDIX family)
MNAGEPVLQREAMIERVRQACRRFLYYCSVSGISFEPKEEPESKRARAMTPDEKGNPWLTVSSKQVYDNPWITVREDRVIRPDGEPGIYGVVHYKNIAVAVLAIDEDHVYLVGQYRFPLERYSWEIPEGGCPEGEEPLRAAQRELREETGLEAASWRMLGEAYLSNSVADEYAVWFLATGLTPGEQQPEGTERLSIRRVPLHEAMAMALNGGITDALSILAIMSYALKLPGDAR